MYMYETIKSVAEHEMKHAWYVFIDLRRIIFYKCRNLSEICS